MKRNTIIPLIICVVLACLCPAANYHFVSPPVMKDYQPITPTSITLTIYSVAGDSIGHIALTSADTLRPGVYEKTWSNDERGPVIGIWDAFVGTIHQRDVQQYRRLEDSVATNYATALQVYNLAVMSGFFPGGHFHTNYHPNADTTWVYGPGDTLKIIIPVSHPSGTPGAAPDSGKTVSP
jgi:hypothetical protein